MDAASDNDDLAIGNAKEPCGISIDRSGNARSSRARRISPSPISETTDLTVRCPTHLDIPAVAALFSEMQRHYRRPVTHEQAVEAATLACRHVNATFDPRVLVATADSTIVGSIVLVVTFPAFELSRALYIRDLYVAHSMRRNGVGQALVQAAARLTYAQGFSALDWTTETDNIAARGMYESCGARVLPRTYYRLARENMDADWRHPAAATPAGIFRFTS
jgi:ribosomal protein S18 acetylase RimI-like enzyme